MKKLFLLGLLSISFLEYASDNKASLLDEAASATAAAGGASNQRVYEQMVLDLDLFTTVVDRHSRPFVTSIPTGINYTFRHDLSLEAINEGVTTSFDFVYDPACTPVIDFAEILDPREDFLAFINAMKAATYDLSLGLDSESDQSPERYSLLDPEKIEQARRLVPNSIERSIKLFERRLKGVVSDVGRIIAEQMHAKYKTQIENCESETARLKSEIAQLKEQAREKYGRELGFVERFSAIDDAFDHQKALNELIQNDKWLPSKQFLVELLQARLCIDKGITSSIPLENGNARVTYTYSIRELHEITALVGRKKDYLLAQFAQVARDSASGGGASASGGGASR